MEIVLGLLLVGVVMYIAIGAALRVRSQEGQTKLAAFVALVVVGGYFL